MRLKQKFKIQNWSFQNENRKKCRFLGPNLNWPQKSDFLEKFSKKKILWPHNGIVMSCPFDFFSFDQKKSPEFKNEKGGKWGKFVFGQK